MQRDVITGSLFQCLIREEWELLQKKEKEAKEKREKQRQQKEVTEILQQSLRQSYTAIWTVCGVG